MLHVQIAQALIQMEKEDLTLREQLIKENVLFEGYHPRMEALHNQNADKLTLIIEQIGFPTPEKVGEEAYEAAWLVVQHAISKPVFMKSCAQLLEREVKDKKVKKTLWAYLVDRIAVFENKKQLYGTQFDWNEQAELSPLPIKYRKTVNKRRLAIGLNTLEEQIEIMRKQTIQENANFPIDYLARKKKADEWKKKVGWIQ